MDMELGIKYRIPRINDLNEGFIDESYIYLYDVKLTGCCSLFPPFARQMSLGA